MSINPRDPAYDEGRKNIVDSLLAQSNIFSAERNSWDSPPTAVQGASAPPVTPKANVAPTPAPQTYGLVSALAAADARRAHEATQQAAHAVERQRLAEVDERRARLLARLEATVSYAPADEVDAVRDMLHRGMYSDVEGWLAGTESGW
jgi:hypothetical protein